MASPSIGRGALGSPSRTIIIGTAGCGTPASAEEFNKTSDVTVEIDVIGKTAMGSPQAPDVFFNRGGGSIRPCRHAAG